MLISPAFKTKTKVQLFHPKGEGELDFKLLPAGGLFHLCGSDEAIIHDDADGLCCRGNDFTRVIKEADFDLLILGDEELGMGFHGVDDTALV